MDSKTESVEIDRKMGSFPINMSFDVSLTVKYRVPAIRSWNLIIFASESKADAYLYSTKKQSNFPLWRGEVVVTLWRNVKWLWSLKFRVECEGKSFSEALILASTNPQYDKRLFMDLPVQYIKTTSSEHVVVFSTFKTIYVHNMFWACSFHVLNW